MRTYSVRYIGVWRERFCVKVDKVRIATTQDTVNHEIDQVDRTCGCAYISGIIDSASGNGDVYTISIFLLRSDFTHNHGVENLILSVTKDIFKSNYEESVCALNAFVLGAL